MRNLNLNALGLLWGALALLIFLYMETLINLTAAVGIAAAIVLFMYLHAAGQSKTDVELDDEELQRQIILWTNGMRRLKKAQREDAENKDEQYNNVKTELARLAEDYKIEKLK